ncbi:MAG: hypothetical protein K5979_01685 [Ruminococcus sp.]|nr:hypothetical protein [Ruminococcus sp.]
MKKMPIILSIALAASFTVPTVSNAKNNYPTSPKVLSPKEIDALSEEEYAKYTADFKAFEKSLSDAYQNNEYDWDFNSDGNTNAIDALNLEWYYAELATNTKKDTYYDVYEKDGVKVCDKYSFTDEIRAKVAENGDINGDGSIDTKDAVYMLTAMYDNEETGDVNLDGFVDARDASLMLAYYSANSVAQKSDAETEACMTYLGDFNDDGVTDAKDASTVLSKYSKNSVTE